MTTLERFQNDERSLTQWLNEYEAQKKEVEEKCLDQISSTEDYEALPDADRQLLDTHNADRALLVEARVALDYVKTATFTTPSFEDCRKLQCMSLMNSKEEYTNSLAVLTNGLDKRMKDTMELTREGGFSSRFMSLTNYNWVVNAPLMDPVIAELLTKEMETEKTVADLVKVIKLTRDQRDDLNISDKNVIDDTVCATINDKNKLHLLHVQDPTEQKEIPEIVESIDGYVLNISAPSPETNKEVSEKVHNGNEVVHNEAPRATTTDPAKVGGNVKLEEVHDKGSEDKTPVKPKNNGKDDR